MTHIDRPPVDEAEAFGRARSHVYGQLVQQLKRAYPLPKNTMDADQKFNLLLERLAEPS